MRDSSGRRRRTPRFRSLPLAIAAALLVGQATPPPVAADHGGRPIGSLFNCDRPGVSPPRCTSVGNNLHHRVHFDASLTEGLESSLRDTMAEDYDPTDLVVTEEAEITSATDVIAFSQDYGDNGAAGWVYCPTDAPQGANRHGDRWCLHQELHFNINPRYAVFFADDASRDHVACHELGHSIGLRHWGNPPTSAEPAADTCMNSNTPDGPTVLHDIDRDHINAYVYSSIPPVHGPRFIAESPGVVSATEIESYPTLEEMVAGADAVVRGRVASVELGRVFGNGAGALQYAAATIRVEELVAGDLPSVHQRELVLEVPLFGGPGSLGAAAEWLGSGESLYFLRSKGASALAAGLPAEQVEADAGYYRLVTLGAIAHQVAGLVAAPAAEDPDVLSALDGSSYAALVERVRAAGR